MTWDQVEGNWKQMKGAVKEKWGKLTDNDLAVARGRAESLSGRLQKRYGINKDEAEKQMSEFARVHRIN